MVPTKRDARIAGLLYLIVGITGPFVMFYVPGKLYVPGDATASAANILAHIGLFKASIFIGIFSNLAFFLAILALYRLLKGVDATLATLMASLILIIMPMCFLESANDVATLHYLTGTTFLGAFDKPQQDALLLYFHYFDSAGLYVYELFWGLWLLPLGMLVYRSRFLPRFIGIWLFINGIAYVAVSATGILAPAYAKPLSTYAAPLFFGELVLMLWLVIVGIREQGNELTDTPTPSTL